MAECRDQWLAWLPRFYPIHPDGQLPANPEAGAKDLGERSQQYHLTGAIKFIDGLLVLAFKAQFTIGTVLNDQHVVFIRQGNELKTALIAHGHTRRILEIWDQIDEFGLLAQGA